MLTTLAGGISAHIAANRYDFLVMSYFATGNRLRQRVNEWGAHGAPTDEVRWTAFVEDCEHAISVENESWLAKWAEEEAEAS